MKMKLRSERGSSNSKIPCWL